MFNIFNTKFFLCNTYVNYNFLIRKETKINGSIVHKIVDQL